MGLFDNWFGNTKESNNQPNVSFGRYSDSYKTDKQYKAWQDALILFDEGKHFDAYEAFFDYLKDPDAENLYYQRLGDTHFDFEFYQGSKKIKGYSDGKKIRVIAKVAKANKLHLAFMRTLVEKNFQLQHSRFALDEHQDIVIVFDSYLLDGSPHKLYFAMQELSTQADKIDDLLVNEFEELQAIDTQHIQYLTLEEKKVKYQFLIDNIKKVIQNADNAIIDNAKYAQAVSYILLQSVYKLDYLIKPEGMVMEVFEKINRNYFLENGQVLVEKNKFVKSELESLLEFSEKVFNNELYNTINTFGTTEVVSQEQISGFIHQVLKDFDWYYDNKYEEVALSIVNYIVGYGMFYWAMPRPIKAMFHLYYEVLEHQYFMDLGFNDVEFWKNNHLYKYNIIKEIKHIAKMNKKQFGDMNIHTERLNFDNIHLFGKSFLLMIKEMEVDSVF